MTLTDLAASSPLIVVAAAAALVMLAGAFGAGPRTLHWLTISSTGLALGSIGWARSLAPREMTQLLRLDGYALLFLTVLYSVTGILIVMARPYLRARDRQGEAFYTLLLMAATGMGVLACSTHFASFVLGLETLTVALYVLLGYFRDDRESLEAAAKYLILAALATGFLLFGIALIYAAAGTLLLAPAIGTAVDLATAGQQPEGLWAAAGLLMLLVGFAFKLALVPFHMWSPDVYQGAPAPVTALIATGSKGAVVAVLLRALVPDIGGDGLLAPTLAALAMVTMLGGNLLALLQTDIKRLLAYSSVAHLGYVMVGFAAGGRVGGEAIVFYFITYAATTLGAFGVVTALSTETEHDADSLDSYRGLGRRRPLLAGVLTVMLLSLAGVPPTAGFLAKFAVLGAALESGRWLLAVTLALASGIGLYYYLRVLVVMYMDDAVLPARPFGNESTTGPASGAPQAAAVPFASSLTLAALVAVVLAIGLHPDPWLRAVGAAVSSIF